MHDPAVWDQMARQLRLPGLALPGDYGGDGFGLTELEVVLEEMGAALLCSPFFATVVLAAQALLASADQAACARYLPGIAAGQTIATLAAAEGNASWDPAMVSARAERTGDHWALTGKKSFVIDGAIADLVLVVARSTAGPGLFAVDRGAPGLRAEPMTTLDPTRRDGGPDLRPGARGPHRREGQAGRLMSRVLDLACVALAAEQAGGARRCLEMSAGYARARFQFGRPIGSFQAVKHKCADMLVRVELAEATAREAARLADEAARGLPRGRGDGAHLLLPGLHVRCGREHPGARRHRLHLGAPGPPVLPPRQVLRAALRRPGRLPRAAARPAGHLTSQWQFIYDGAERRGGARDDAAARSAAGGRDRGAAPAADVVIEADRIAAVEAPGTVAGDGDVVDLDGLVLAPGFIDCHTHYDAQVLWDPDLTPSSWHGVTTVVMGNCGFGIAPTRPAGRETIARTLENVEGMSVEALFAGIPWTFETFPEYLDAVERAGPKLNVAVMLGHTPLRLYVLGEEAAERDATSAEIEEMRRLVGEALDAGAVGFASSRQPAHAGAWGKPVPSRLATVDELMRLAEPLAERGRGTFAITHGPDFGPVELAELSVKTGRPVTWTALNASPGAFRLLDKAAARGGEVWPQVACRPIVFQVTLAEPAPFARADAFARGAVRARRRTRPVLP